MAEELFISGDEERLKHITEQIVRLANADFGTPGVPSEKGDDLDAIVIGLNLLGEELEAYTQELKAKEDRITHMLVQLKDAQHLSRIGSWEWMAENTITWSDELYRIYGRDKDTFAASFDHFIACIHPDDREYVSGIIQNAHRDKKDFSFSHRIVRPDETEVFLDCKGTVYLADDGSVYRMTGTAQDVTELKKAEEHIVKLAAIVESSYDAIISKTPDGYITSWNRQAEKLFGYEEQEALGNHISILFTPEQREKGYDLMAALDGGENQMTNYEVERMRKDGRTIVVSSTISPIRNAQGKVIGFSKIARDITEKKQAEERLLRYMTALEQKNKETEQFAYITSHDLQEPLRTITNYIGLFRDDYKGKLDGHADLYINFISNASVRMQVLISDLLEYTRLDNDYEPAEIDCNLLLNELVTDLEQTIRENDAAIVYGDLPLISGHFSRIKSLFQNLISNAIKFRKPDAAPQIRITAQDRDHEWLFEIRDNGIGIEETYYEKIFMLFQRLHARSEYKGTGIGLAHCKKIVELRGGRIWVTSEYGKGSSFFFTIPKKIIL